MSLGVHVPTRVTWQSRWRELWNPLLLPAAGLMKSCQLVELQMEEDRRCSGPNLCREMPASVSKNGNVGNLL